MLKSLKWKTVLPTVLASRAPRRATRQERHVSPRGVGFLMAEVPRQFLMGESTVLGESERVRGGHADAF